MMLSTTRPCHSFSTLPCAVSFSQTEQLEKAGMWHAALALGCFMNCCLCLGDPWPSWLFLQLTSFPCPLKAGGPPATLPGHPRCTPVPSLLLTAWATYSSRLQLFVARTVLLPQGTPAAWYVEHSNKVCWINEVIPGCCSPHLATVSHRVLFHFWKNCFQGYRPLLVHYPWIRTVNKPCLVLSL